MARTSVKSSTKISKETTTKTKKSQETKKDIPKKDTKKASSVKTSDSFSQKDSNKKNTKKNDRILEVKTTQTGALKQVIERISNFISDCVIVFIPPDESIKEDDDDDYYEEIEEDEDEVEVKSKKKNIKKTKKINDDNDNEDENEDDEPKSKKKSTKKTKKSDDDDSKSKSKNSNNKSQKKNTGGIRILRLTEDKSILVKLHLDAINFEQFRCDEPKITIGVDMHNLHALLKIVNDDDPIVLYMNRDNRSSLYIRSLNENNESSEETDIEIFLMEIGHTEMPIPQTEFQNKITMASDKFHTICKHMNNNSTYVEITSINNEILFRGKNEGGKVTMSYKDVNYNKKKDKPDQVVQGVYELRNLMGFSKCNKLCNTIEIYLKNDFPLVLVISVATLGKMYVFLSPIESGDN